MVSGLVSPAGAHCAAPPADHGASSESPQAGDRKTDRESKSLLKRFMIAELAGLQLDTEIETKFSSSSQQYSVYRKTYQKVLCCFNPDSSSSAHPLYVLDDFIDVGLIDLDLLSGNTQSDEFELHIYLF